MCCLVGIHFLIFINCVIIFSLSIYKTHDDYDNVEINFVHSNSTTSYVPIDTSIPRLDIYVWLLMLSIIKILCELFYMLCGNFLLESKKESTIIKVIFYFEYPILTFIFQIIFYDITGVHDIYSTAGAPAIAYSMVTIGESIERKCVRPYIGSIYTILLSILPPVIQITLIDVPSWSKSAVLFVQCPFYIILCIIVGMKIANQDLKTDVLFSIISGVSVNALFYIIFTN